jgi:tetratricopeptide (TPR) repeat protein
MRRAFGSALIALALLPSLAQAPLLDQGRSALRCGDAETAIELLEKAVTQAPQSAEAHYLLASAYGAKVMSSGMLAAARYGPKMKAAYEKAVALDPRHVDARFGLVQFYAMAPGNDGRVHGESAGPGQADQGGGPHPRPPRLLPRLQPAEEAGTGEEGVSGRGSRSAHFPQAHSFFGQYLGSARRISRRPSSNSRPR